MSSLQYLNLYFLILHREKLIELLFLCVELYSNLWFLYKSGLKM